MKKGVLAGLVCSVMSVTAFASGACYEAGNGYKVTVDRLAGVSVDGLKLTRFASVSQGDAFGSGAAGETTYAIRGRNGYVLAVDVDADGVPTELREAVRGQRSATEKQFVECE